MTLIFIHSSINLPQKTNIAIITKNECELTCFTRSELQTNIAIIAKNDCELTCFTHSIELQTNKNKETFVAHITTKVNYFGCASFFFSAGERNLN